MHDTRRVRDCADGWVSVDELTKAAGEKTQHGEGPLTLVEWLQPSKLLQVSSSLAWFGVGLPTS